MSKKLEKQIKANPQFGPEVRAKSDPLIDKDGLSKHFTGGTVSISLRYYQKSCECFSEWKQAELKSFSQTVDKIGGYSAQTLCAKKNLCEIHKGNPKRGRFRLPEGLSEDQSFWEIKVDQANKLRIHGFFVRDVFFLVWLDREHECFPYKKN